MQDRSFGLVDYVFKLRLSERCRHAAFVESM